MKKLLATTAIIAGLTQGVSGKNTNGDVNIIHVDTNTTKIEEIIEDKKKKLLKYIGDKTGEALIASNKHLDDNNEPLNCSIFNTAYDNAVEADIGGDNDDLLIATQYELKDMGTNCYKISDLVERNVATFEKIVNDYIKNHKINE